MNYWGLSYAFCGIFNALFTGIPMLRQTYKWFDSEMKTITDIDSEENYALSRMFFKRNDIIAHTIITSWCMGWFYTLRIVYGLVKSVKDPNHLRIINDINFKCPYNKEFDYLNPIGGDQQDDQEELLNDILRNSHKLGYKFPILNTNKLLQKHYDNMDKYGFFFERTY